MSRKIVAFRWTKAQSKAAELLAAGYTIKEAADAAHCATRSIDRWKCDINFSAEVDRLSHMVGVALRAERLRATNRIVRKILEKAEEKSVLPTREDLLDWLKFAQSETDGAKLDLTNLLTTLTQTGVSNEVAGAGSDGTDPDPQP